MAVSRSRHCRRPLNPICDSTRGTIPFVFTSTRASDSATVQFLIPQRVGLDLEKTAGIGTRDHVRHFNAPVLPEVWTAPWG
jgi:hypothetical protein